MADAKEDWLHRAGQLAEFNGSIARCDSQIPQWYFCDVRMRQHIRITQVIHYR